MSLSEEKKETKLSVVRDAPAKEAEPEPTRADAVDNAREIVKRFETWQRREAAMKKAGEQASEAIKGAFKKLNTVMGEAVPERSTVDEITKRLKRQAKAFADWQTAISEGQEARSVAKEKRKEAFNAFGESMESGKQLSLLL